MNKSLFKPARRTTLSEDICQQLLNLIGTGEFSPGDKLPSERELTEMFSVGRSSVREALRALALLGVVETRQGDGAYVASQDAKSFSQSVAWRSLFSVQTSLEFIEARKVVEEGTVELAALRATPDDIALLEPQIAEMDANTSDVLKFADLDTNFHATLAEIAGNSLLLRFVVELRGLLHEHILGDLRNSTQSEIARYVAEHSDIVKAIRNGDVNLARQTMRRHLDDVSRRLTASISGQQGTEQKSATES